jgi:hypothetical protein
LTSSLPLYRLHSVAGLDETESMHQRPIRAAFWSARREATLNWLALGLLLAAWNACDNDAANAGTRPQTLRGYSCISVRAVNRVLAKDS